MEQVRGEASPGKRGVRGGLANKLEADFRANALVSIIRELMASGFVSRRALAEELNRRGIPTARGGKWHCTTVVRMLNRQGLLTWGKGARINNGQARKHAADLRAEALAATIAKLWKAGFVSINTIARELSEQEIPTAQGGKWHPTSVKRLLRRLERIDAMQQQQLIEGQMAAFLASAPDFALRVSHWRSDGQGHSSYSTQLDLSAGVSVCECRGTQRL